MRVSSRLKPMTATEMFKQQVNNTTQFARSELDSSVFLPMQFGGLFGQRVTVQNALTINITSIDGR